MANETRKPTGLELSIALMSFQHQRVGHIIDQIVARDGPACSADDLEDVAAVRNLCADIVRIATDCLNREASASREPALLCTCGVDDNGNIFIKDSCCPVHGNLR